MRKSNAEIPLWVYTGSSCMEEELLCTLIIDTLSHLLCVRDKLS